MTTEQFIQGLREVADFYEQHPALEPPDYGASHQWYGCSKEEMAAAARIPGKWDKGFAGSDDEMFMLSRKVGVITLELHGDREEVCERVVVGTKEEPGRVEPAKPEQYIPARTIEIVEWRCGSLLAPEPEVVNA